MSFNKIVVRTAWEHNLKGFEVEMPRYETCARVGLIGRITGLQPKQKAPESLPGALVSSLAGGAVKVVVVVAAQSLDGIGSTGPDQGLRRAVANDIRHRDPLCASRDPARHSLQVPDIFGIMQARKGNAISREV